MKIELRRIKRTAEVRCAEPVEVIDGHLFIDGIKICDTAENATRALPEGDYLVTIAYCKQYKRKVLVLSPACPELCRREGLRLEAATREAIVTGGEASDRGRSPKAAWRAVPDATDVRRWTGYFMIPPSLATVQCSKSATESITVPMAVS